MYSAGLAGTDAAKKVIVGSRVRMPSGGTAPGAEFAMRAPKKGVPVSVGYVRVRAHTVR